MNTDATPTPDINSWSYPLGLFQAFGIELEYMIVDRRTLDILPIADKLFATAAGAEVADVEPDGPDGPVFWSNELALHVAELKTARPTPTLEGVAEHFQDHVARIDAILEPMGGRLLPTGMHPWMDPDRETRLWPHECNEIYATYDRIFGCSGHGWGNLQSTHINLPFANDDEFGRLHAAIRLVLPLLPAIAASSPIVDGHLSPIADHRLEVYRNNSLRIPMMAGLVIPEPVFSRAGYERDILGRLYDDLQPHDPEGILRYEFANSRGCIARFDRGSIEIRLLDIQECPLADMAIVVLVVEVLKAIVQERWISYEQQKRIPTEPLSAIFLDTIRDAENTPVSEPLLLEAFGLSQSTVSAGEIWSILFEQVLPDHPIWSPLLRRLLHAGTLSTRIRNSLPASPTKPDLHTVFQELADCLHDGSLFRVA